MTQQEHRQEFEKKMMAAPPVPAQIACQMLGSLSTEQRMEAAIMQFTGMLVYLIYKDEADVEDTADLVEKTYAVHTDVEEFVHRYVKTAKQLTA